MRQLLDSDLELVVESGFIYVPLLLDPAIEREIHTLPKPDTLIQGDGKLFIKTLSLQSVVENYEKIDTDVYEQLRNACQQKYRHALGLNGILISEKLRTILFHVMPHFIRRHKSLERKRRSEEEILDLIGERIKLAARYHEDAAKILDTDSLREALHDLGEQRATIDPLRDGLISARKLREWLLQTLELKIVDNERGILREALQEREQLSKTQRKYLAMLLYIAEKGSLEIDGFGFFRMGMTDEYIIYKHTGEYALQDYYGRNYLFPDCRVGVSTIVPLKPVVLDTYKHPFLEGCDSRQPICLRGYSPPKVFTAANAINALQEGMNALLYGYSSRRRNGYHSLDRTTRYVGTIDSDDSIIPEEDYPVISTRYVRTVNFDDYRVTSDHPKIASGQVEITNNYTP